MDGALISYHNTQRIFGFEYITLVDMERRILGNSNFSDTIFKASIKLLQEALDQIVKDFSDQNKIFVGVFANEWKGALELFVEIIDENSYKDYIDSTYVEIIDYYHLTGYRPNVHKYTIYTTTMLNDVVTVTPIQYENNDYYSVNYQLIYEGKVTFDEYMKFLHEAYMADNFNLNNVFNGSWTNYQ